MIPTCTKMPPLGALGVSSDAVGAQRALPAIAFESLWAPELPNAPKWNPKDPPDGPTWGPKDPPAPLKEPKRRPPDPRTPKKGPKALVELLPSSFSPSCLRLTRLSPFAVLVYFVLAYVPSIPCLPRRPGGMRGSDPPPLLAGERRARRHGPSSCPALAQLFFPCPEPLARISLLLDVLVPLLESSPTSAHSVGPVQMSAL